MRISTITDCKCGHSDLRHEIPIITPNGKVSEMRCNVCPCSDYDPIKFTVTMEVN